MTQNLKTRAYFMQNDMELEIKKISDPKALTFEVWDLKTRYFKAILGQKSFAKYKLLDENTSFNFQKQHLTFS